jgi:hypothetical protein
MSERTLRGIGYRADGLTDRPLGKASAERVPSPR